MNLNKQRFLELIKEGQKRKNHGKHFWDFDKWKRLELNKYIILFESQIFWSSRQEYCKILDLFISKKINADDFSNQFFDIRWSNSNATDELKKSFENEFDGIINKINDIEFSINLKS